MDVICKFNVSLSVALLKHGGGLIFLYFFSLCQKRVFFQEYLNDSGQKSQTELNMIGLIGV